MTTYRVGTHHGVTICREGDGYICGREDHDCARGHLVAVVLRDDCDFAEHICDRLNAPTPDVTHTNGAAEAFTQIRRQITAWSKLHGSGSISDTIDLATLSGMLRAAAAELGVKPTPEAGSNLEQTGRNSEPGDASEHTEGRA